MKRICVFCGSSPGGQPVYMQAARDLGKALAERGLGLVFGGGRVGLMGEVARAALDAGAQVTGVIPEALLSEAIAFTELTDLRIVRSMHERKALMVELADAFIALPGGFGTLEELFEVLTWAQLGIHRKPCGLLDVNCYFAGLAGFLDHSVEQEFIRTEHRAMLLVDDEPSRLLERIEIQQVPVYDKAAWVLEVNRRNQR